MDSSEKPKPPQADMQPKLPDHKAKLSAGQKIRSALLAPLAAIGLFGGAQVHTAEARTAPEGSGATPITNVHNEEQPNPDINPLQGELNPAPAAKPDEGVPADPVDLNNVYVKKSEAEPASDINPAKPMPIDGNQRIDAPDGTKEDMLPRMQPGENAPTLAKQNDESALDPQPDENTSGPVPAVEPRGIHIDGNGRISNEDGSKSDMLPMVPRQDDGSIIAATKPEASPLPVPEKDEPVTPIMNPATETPDKRFNA